MGRRHEDIFDSGSAVFYRSSVGPAHRRGSKVGAVMKLEPGKSYKTRDGRTAKVLCTDAPGKFRPCVGYISARDDFIMMCWDASGRVDHSEIVESPIDLVSEYREPQEWLLVRVERRHGTEWSAYAPGTVIDYAGNEVPRMETIRVREVLDP